MLGDPGPENRYLGRRLKMEQKKKNNNKTKQKLAANTLKQTNDVCGRGIECN